MKELRIKTVQELVTLLAQKRKELQDVRFTIASTQEKKQHVYRATRKLIARILTLLGEKKSRVQ